MSDSGEFNPNWWREEKAMSLARRVARSPGSGTAAPGDSFLIVTEGTVTEPIYFNLVKADLQLPAVRVKVIPGKASDPRHVIRTAADEAKEQVRRARKGGLGLNEPSRFDHVWAVIDSDVAVRNGIWNDVVQLASARGVTLAHSTPCFEFWLLLHFHYTTRGDLPDGDAAKSAVQHALGEDYGTAGDVACRAIASIIGRWPEAVIHGERVRQHHLAAATPAPANPSTEVDRLVRALNDSAPAHLRKLTR
jgi:hypothetical protein